MTLNPSDSLPGCLVLEQPNHRAAGLARALGARKLRTGGKVRYFLPGRKAEQFSSLYAAGFWALPGKRFRRDPRPLDLYGALAASKPISSLTANAAEPKTTD